MATIRLNKYISDTGFCSRREADQLIDDERVTVNGSLPQKGEKVSIENDKVRVDGELIKYINLAQEIKRRRELEPTVRTSRQVPTAKRKVAGKVDSRRTSRTGAEQKAPEEGTKSHSDIVFFKGKRVYSPKNIAAIKQRGGSKKR